MPSYAGQMLGNAVGQGTAAATTSVPATTSDAGSSSSSWLGAAAGAIPVVGGIISGIINANNTASQNAANRAWASQQQAAQNAYNMNMWNLQNQYNSPAAAMARFKAAGLNPNLIYGAGASSATFAGTPPMSVQAPYHAEAPQAPDFASAGAQAVNAYNATLSQQANTANVNAETANKVATLGLIAAQRGNVQADTTLKGVQAVNVAADTDVKRATLPEIAANVNAINANIGKTLAETQFVLDDNDRQDISTAANVSEAFSRVLLNKQSILTQQLQNTLIPSQKAEIQSKIDNLKSLTSDTNLQYQLHQMDINMRNNGIMPHDGAWTRAVDAVFNGWNNTAGGNPRAPFIAPGGPSNSINPDYKKSINPYFKP